MVAGAGMTRWFLVGFVFIKLVWAGGGLVADWDEAASSTGQAEILIPRHANFRWCFTGASLIL
jgi:hypothetical protein